jgi:hypothetical protein
MSKREFTENLERGTIILLKSWEQHKSVNQEKVSLSEYEGLMKSICRTGDFRSSEKLLNIFLEFSKKHGGEKTPSEDAKTLHNIAEWLDTHILKWTNAPLVMEFYKEEARMWALAGKKNKEEEALQSACAMALHLRSVEENSFREMHFNEDDFGEKKAKKMKEAWEKLYQQPQDELAFSLELFLREHAIEPFEKKSTAVFDCDQVRNNIWPFLQAVEKIKVIPCYQSVLTYLMDMYYQRVSEGTRREFFLYVENGLPQEWNKFTSVESYKFLWNELSDSLEKDYHKNKVEWAEEKYENWQEYFYELVCNFSEEHLVQLAKATHMIKWRQQEFLQRVMHVSEQNCDKSEEVFFELVDQLRKLLLEDQAFLDYRENRDFKRFQEKLYKRNRKVAEVRVLADSEVEIRKGDKLQCEVKLPKGIYQAHFKVQEDITLEKNVPAQAEVALKALTSSEVLEHYRRAKKLKVKPKMVKRHHITKADLRAADEKMQEKISSITLLEKGGALPFVKEDDNGNGKLLVCGEAGTVLEPGTLFLIEEMVGGELFCFAYEVAQKAVLERKAELKLLWENGDEIWNWAEAEDGKEIAESFTQLMPGWKRVPGRLKGAQFYLKKPLKICGPIEEMLPDGTTDTEDEVKTKDRYEKMLKKSNRKGSIRGRSEENQDMPKISNLELLEYIYHAPADSTDYYRDVKRYGRDYFLNSSMFIESRLKNDILDHFVRNRGVRRRSLILTLIFLVYVIEMEQHKTDGSWDGMPLKWVIDDFETEVNAVMERCGMVSFNLDNPYDAFLELLLHCKEPLELYQEIWSTESCFERGV